jgi:hypothetical protein
MIHIFASEYAISRIDKLINVENGKVGSTANLYPTIERQQSIVHGNYILWNEDKKREVSMCPDLA